MIIINGIICPTVDNDSILISKSIVDIENPEQKTIEHSKSIMIENTAAVATLFGNIFEVNLDIQNVTELNFNPDFNPNLKAKCVVLDEFTVVLSGYCQLTEIVLIDDNKVVYLVTVFGGLGNLFNEIKYKNLSDIDFSDLNHNWTKTNIVNSWTPTLGVGYVYPMVDYGLTNNYQYWNTLYFRPAVFVKDIIDRLFINIGWSYQSAFFSTTRFKSLVIPYNAEKLVNSNTTLSNRMFKVGNGGSNYGSGDYNDPDSQAKVNLDTDSGAVGVFTMNNDSGGNFNTTTFEWTCAANGNYAFGVELEAYMTDGIAGYTIQEGKCFVSIVLERGGIRYYNESFELIFDTFSAGQSADSVLSVTSAPMGVDIGDKIYVVCTQFEGDDSFITRLSKADGEMDIYFNYIILHCIPQPELVYADTVDMNSILPNDIKQVDFLMGLAKMFNLYIEQIEDKKVIIEPREDYYISDIVDWTDKLDIGSEVKLVPMALLQQKRYKFSYNEDSDRLNNLYQTAYKEVYGTKLYDCNNDFLTETKEIKPLFAATPLSTIDRDDKIISQMQFIDQDGAIKQGKTKLRILYWGGLLDCRTWYMEETLGASATAKQEYPYAGHLDNPFVPTFDLLYAPPYNVYYDYNIGANSDVEYPDINLYSEYWHKMIEEITNKNSKVLEGWFNISTYDWVNLSFRKQYFIKDAYYRLLEIEDYNIDGRSLTKCKFLKINKEQAYTTSTKVLRGGTDTYDSGGDVPTRLPMHRGQDTNTKRLNTNYSGVGNYENGKNLIIRGSNNRIPDGVEDVFILGSNNNRIYKDRVMIFNSDMESIYRSAAVVNNCYLEYKLNIQVNDTWLQTADGGATVEVLPSLRANEYYEINKVFFKLGSGTNYVWTGTGDVTLRTSTTLTTVGSILGTDWVGLGEGVIAKGTATVAQDFGEAIELLIDGTYSSGSRLVYVVIYYNIITV